LSRLLCRSRPSSTRNERPSPLTAAVASLAVRFVRSGTCTSRVFKANRTDTAKKSRNVAASAARSINTLPALHTRVLRAMDRKWYHDDPRRVRGAPQRAIRQASWLAALSASNVGSPEQCAADRFEIMKG